MIMHSTCRLMTAWIRLCTLSRDAPGPISEPTDIILCMGSANQRFYNVTFTQNDPCPDGWSMEGLFWVYCRNRDPSQFKKYCITGKGTPILNVKQSRDHHIFIMEIIIHGKRVHLEMGPSFDMIPLCTVETLATRTLGKLQRIPLRMRYFSENFSKYPTIKVK